MKKHKNRPARKPLPASLRPEVGSDAYFDSMPAAQAREELKITWKNKQRLERKLSEISAGLASFRALLDGSE